MKKSDIKTIEDVEKYRAQKEWRAEKRRKTLILQKKVEEGTACSFRKFNPFFDHRQTFFFDKEFYERFVLTHQMLSSDSGYLYCKVKINGREIVTGVHRVVYAYYRRSWSKRGETVIHHKDVNIRNNMIENLDLITVEEHEKIHRSMPNNFWSIHNGKSDRVIQIEGYSNI